MSINNIITLNYSYFFISSSIDYEEKKIAAKLRSYGITPSGNKSKDKAKLYEIELREAKQLDSTTNNLLTIDKTEQDKIQQEKKEKKGNLNSEKYLNSHKAQKLIGEQIFITNQMNKKKKHF